MGCKVFIFLPFLCLSVCPSVSNAPSENFSIKSAINLSSTPPPFFQLYIAYITSCPPSTFSRHVISQLFHYKISPSYSCLCVCNMLSFTAFTEEHSFHFILSDSLILAALFLSSFVLDLCYSSVHTLLLHCPPLTFLWKIMPMCH